MPPAASPQPDALLVPDVLLVPDALLVVEEIGDGLPCSLAPFDIPQLLAMLGGKRDLAKRLLISFHDGYVTAEADLALYVAEENWDEARRLAHSLKGVAGTLAAPSLSMPAAELEEAIEAGKFDQAAAVVTVVRAALREAVAAVATLPVTPEPGAEADGDPLDGVRDILYSLRDLSGRLRVFDFEAAITALDELSDR